ncbi:MAG TPA: alpha-L-arabinofuranosidase C-terminal domain-containing protein [Bryobacteraceae bacterium]|nr:alpha-L-arabinofuranosidase C-terminal domain-containing protein [Bryobacteraceae bacterium]
MLKPSRRQVIAGLALPVVSRALRGQNSTASVEVHANVEIGAIRPELHGHFAEHLGSCTYGGLWVGKQSPIPNINGHRRQAVEWLKQVGIPVLRWPGGCFADEYHWRDGIGPHDKRPKTVNIHWGNYTEDNSFGTHEFIELCRLIGAEPYLAANLGSGSPQEMRNWIEYCNYPSGSTLSDERAKNGASDPFKVKYWGIGNENWGCGGEMQPEEYCAHYRQFSTYVREFGGVRPFKIACGPNGNNTDWTRRFFDALRGKRGPEGFAMHFYSNSRSTSTNFDNTAAEEQLSSFQRIERAVIQQRALLDSYDPDRRIGLLVDEWGVWDRMVPAEEKQYGALFQQITMRSAVAAALGLNVFHRQAEKLVMCNIAQIVNVLHSLILTDGPRACRTTTYWAFDMLKAHRGRTSVRVSNPDPAALALSVSASKQGNELVLTFVNPKPSQALDVSCAISGANPASATATLLNHASLNAANTFDQPDLIMPKPIAVQAAAGKLTMNLPALSIATVRVKLA